MSVYHEVSQANCERAMLGCAVLNPSLYCDLRGYVSSPDFFTDAMNRDAFALMDECYVRAGVLDTAELCDLVVQREVPGMVSHIAGLAGAVPTSANWKVYAKACLEAYQRRSLAVHTKALAEYTTSKRASIPGIEKHISRIADICATRDAREEIATADELSEAAATSLLDRIESKGMVGIGTGYGSIDRMLGGMRPGMHVIGARPGLGKTSLALNISRNVCRDGGRVLFVSLEMEAIQLAERMMMMIGGIDENKLSSGFLGRAEANKVPNAMNEFSKMKFVVVKPPTFNPLKMRAVVASESLKERISLIVIDYLQLMTGESNENRQVEVSGISRAIKLLSGEFSVPIIALSQVGRDADDTVPNLKHLRESGAIEQDADTVMMLQKDEKDANKLTCAIRKNRHGRVGICSLHYQRETQRIRDLGASQSEPAPQAEQTYEENDDAW